MAEQSELFPLNFRQTYERTDEDAATFALDVEDMSSYNDWVSFHEETRSWTEASFIDEVLHTNFHDPLMVDELLRWLDHPNAQPVVLGEYSLNGFRLKPSRAILTPTVPSSTDSATLMPPELLGFIRTTRAGTTTPADLRRNTSISLTSELTIDDAPSDPRKDSVVLKATTFTITAGNDASGFCFFQLGGLEIASAEQWARRFDGVKEEDLVWSKVPNVVVVRVEDDGRGSDIYILPSTENARSPVVQVESAPRDALRDGPASRNTGLRLHMGFKVARSLSGVGGTFWFLISRGLADYIEVPFEYVAAVLERHGEGRRVVREYVPRVLENVAGERDPDEV